MNGALPLRASTHRIVMRGPRDARTAGLCETLRRASVPRLLLATCIAASAASPALADGAEALAAGIAVSPPTGNPYVAAQPYVDSDWSAKVLAEAEASDDERLARALRALAEEPTAVWLDSIAAIAGTPARASLEAHLDRALRQSNGDAPVVLTLVLYNLPDRDCAAGASNGLLKGAQGLERYRREFIDPVANLLARPRYAALRVVAVIEPDSLPNLVTNRTIPACRDAEERGTYVDGIAYALQRFATLDNVRSYLDIGHAGWLGWSSHRARAVPLYLEVARLAGGLSTLQGIATNVSGYTPFEEPLLPQPDYPIEGVPVKAAAFYEYNSMFDERDYVEALVDAFRASGSPEDFGALVDTSRNGWGGAARPREAPWRDDVNAYVDRARIDRRAARGHWCNQAAAGLGAAPRADPVADDRIHAFVWIKPPGESDGTSDRRQSAADAAGKHFDPNCDPDGLAADGLPTGALGGAPAAGDWFGAHLRRLVTNAWPPRID